MSQTFKCGICSSKPEQLSLHKRHIGTQKHKEERIKFIHKLQSMTNEALVKTIKLIILIEIIMKK